VPPRANRASIASLRIATGGAAGPDSHDAPIGACRQKLERLLLAESSCRTARHGDLMALRTIYWLRQAKKDSSGREIPRTAMKAVRRALDEIASLELELWTEHGAPNVAVDRSGRIVIKAGDRLQRPSGQSILGTEMLDLIAPFASEEGLRGPDLSIPRPRLRIVPGKLGGSPHVAQTRLESQALGALAASGLPEAKIYRLYPDIGHEAIEDALDLERQLAENLRPAMAA
jgi:uncharacterized protein (DUF433 family)